MLTLKNKIQKRVWPALAAAVALGAVACGSNTNQVTEPETDMSEGTEQAATGSSGSSGSQEFDIRLSGAGASFPAPLYQRWFSAITKNIPVCR